MNADPLVGRDIDGRLVVLERLNEGGMGVVYKAEHKLLGTKLALKVIHPQLAATDDVRRRFLREARAASALSHPCVVPLREVGEFDGQLYYTMDLIDGQTLEDVLKVEGSLETHQAVGIACQILDALQAAHDRGIVHRDLKPGNVMLEAGGRVRVLDFGLAKWIGPGVSGNDKLTQTGFVVGTFGYMAPEQITGDQVDVRTDLYALSVILYELLSGARPHEASSGASFLRKVVLEDPEALEGPVGAVVMQGLEREPDERPVSAAEFRELLQAAVGAVPVKHRTAVRTKLTALEPAPQSVRALGPPPGRSSRRTRTGWWVVAGLAVLALGAGTWFLGAGVFQEREGGGGSTEDTASVGASGDVPAAREEVPSPLPVRDLTLHMSAPEDGALLGERRVRVEGTVEGDPLGARITVNGAEASVEGNLFKAVVMADGDGPLAIEVRCEGENISCAPRARTVVIDTTAPVIEISAPADSPHETKQAVVRVAGRVVEDHLAELTIEGASVPVASDGRFSWPVALPEGDEVTLRFAARDKAGHEAAPVTRTLRRQKVVAAWEAPLAAAKRAVANQDWPAAERHLQDAIAAGVPAASITELQEATAAKVSQEQIAAARKHGVPVAFENSIGMRFVLIPAGTFPMGSPASEKGRDGDETLHDVTLTKPYYLATTEVTNAQFRRFRRNHDSGTYEDQSLNGGQQPAVDVSWEDAQAFLAWLNRQEGQGGYRLPSEAEWERAARAGTRTRFSFGDREEDLPRYGNIYRSSDGHAVAAPVGSYRPNPWGLYDVHGNVNEWVEDVYGTYPKQSTRDPTGASGPGNRVVRGGSWILSARSARSASRDRDQPALRNFNLGFRPARSVTPKPAKSAAWEAPLAAAKRAVANQDWPAAERHLQDAIAAGVPAASITELQEATAAGKRAAVASQVPTWAKVSQEQIAAARKHGVPVAFENSIGMRFVLIPAGTFPMGSPASEEGREDDETLHDVTLTKPYYVSRYGVASASLRPPDPK